MINNCESEGADNDITIINLLIGGLVTQHFIDAYLELLVNSQYGKRENRVIASINAGVWMYRDIGLGGSSVHESNDRMRSKVASKMKNHPIVLWPLFIPGTKVGHWLLAVIYPTLRVVALLDSSIDKKTHAIIFEVQKNLPTSCHNCLDTS